VILVVALRLPEVPVIVTVVVLGIAVLVVVRVRTLLVVAGFGLNVAVTPAGSFETASVTLPENAFAGVMVMVLVTLLPGSMMTVLAEADMVKLGFATVRLIGMLFVKLPDVPVIVTVSVPLAALALAVKVNVLSEVAGFGLNAAVTPFGKPDAESVTLPLNPFTGMIVIVLVPLLPGATSIVFGDGNTMKLGALVGQLFTKLVIFTEPIPVAKSQPVAAM
jgi:hypothetical protein